MTLFLVSCRHCVFDAHTTDEAEARSIRQAHANRSRSIQHRSDPGHEVKVFARVDTTKTTGTPLESYAA